jgi:hypothetical protein
MAVGGVGIIGIGRVFPIRVPSGAMQHALLIISKLSHHLHTFSPPMGK